MTEKEKTSFSDVNMVKVPVVSGDADNGSKKVNPGGVGIISVIGGATDSIDRHLVGGGAVRVKSGGVGIVSVRGEAMRVNSGGVGIISVRGGATDSIDPQLVGGGAMMLNSGGVGIVSVRGGAMDTISPYLVFGDLEEQVFVWVPFGVAGEECGVVANMYSVMYDRRVYHRYQVTVSPPIQQEYYYHKLMDTLLIDGDLKEFNLVRLDNRRLIAPYFADIPVSFRVKMPDSGNGIVFTVTMKYEGSLQAKSDRMLHKIMRQALLRTTRFYRCSGLLMHPDAQLISIGQKTFRKGLIHTVKETWGEPYLIMDEKASRSKFYEPILVSDFVKTYLGVQRLSGLTANQIARVSTILCGVRVEADNGEYKRKHTIVRIRKETCSEIRFVCDLGGGPRPLNMIEFFLSKYNINVLNFHALDISKGHREACLPMEICRILPHQPYPERFSKKELDMLTSATCVAGKTRMQNVQGVRASRMYNSANPAFKEYGLEVGNNMVEVTARILPPPFVGSVKYNTKVQKWRILNLSHRREEEVTNFCVGLQRLCVNEGITFEEIPVKQMFTARADISLLSKDFFPECSNDKLDILFVILPTEVHLAKRIRAWIKYRCEKVLGIASQCVMEIPVNINHLKKVYDGLSRKINMKMGGCNSYLCKEVHGLNDCLTMVLAVDVAHPKKTDRSSPSIAAVVASIDNNASKYRAILCAQPPWTEIITDLGSLIKDLLVTFCTQNGQRRPSRILYYRDGVSETQFKTVIETEVASILKACKSLSFEFQPKVSCIVVQKRHHIRFFSRDTPDGNLATGTVVEDRATFYLCSSKAHMGNARLNRYVLLRNDDGFTADELHEITYSLCHVYGRCNTSVSLVTPVYYAHLAAARGREYLEGYMDDQKLEKSPTCDKARRILTLPPKIAESMYFC